MLHVSLVSLYAEQPPYSWRGIHGSGVFPAQDLVTEFWDIPEDFDPAEPGLRHMWIQWLDAQHRPPDHGSMTSHISLNGLYISLSNAETPVLIRDGFYWRAVGGRTGQYVLSARDAFNGMLHWTRPWKGSGCAGTKGGSEARSRQLAGMGDVIYTIEQTKPSVMNAETGYIVYEPELTATDASDGSIRFAVSLPSCVERRDDLFCDAGVVMVHRPDAAVYAFDAVTGAKKWEHAGPARQVAADRGRLSVGIAGGDAPGVRMGRANGLQMNTTRRSFLKLLCILLLLVLPAAGGAEPTPVGRDQAPARNLVLIIGDGMGAAHVQATSLFFHGRPDALFMQSAPHQGSM